MKTVAAVAGTVATSATAVVRFPESWLAAATGWTLYLTMALVSTTWYAGLLNSGHALHPVGVAATEGK